MKFIPDWKECYKWWSVWVSAAGAILMAVLSVWPDSILLLWNMMPTDVKKLLPNQLSTILAVFIFAMTVLSRVLDQPGKQEDGGKTDSESIPPQS